MRGKLGLDAGEHPRQHDELATIPVIGQCLGAGEKKQAQRYSVTLLGIAITGLAVTNAALFFLMPEVVTWFNLSAEASAMCTHVVHWFNLFSIFFWQRALPCPTPARGRRRQVYDVGQHRQHVAVPRDSELYLCSAVPL
mgnify:CR=1 FL=1